MQQVMANKFCQGNKVWTDFSTQYYLRMKNDNQLAFNYCFVLLIHSRGAHRNKTFNLFLLPDNSEALKKRISYFAILQTLLMVFILSLAGAMLSPMTGLHDALLEGLLQGTTHVKALLPIMLPTVLYAFFGLMVFLVLFYGLIARLIDKKICKSWPIFVPFLVLMAVFFMAVWLRKSLDAGDY